MKRIYILAVAINGIAFAANAQPGLGQRVPLSDPNGVYCREYTQQVLIGGAKRQGYGTACQQPDGAWKIISTDQAPSPDQEVQYISPPQFVSAPQYIVPPPEYYAPAPYYPAPYYGSPYPYAEPYPYPGYASGISIGIGSGYDGHGGHHGYYHR